MTNQEIAQLLRAMADKIEALPADAITTETRLGVIRLLDYVININRDVRFQLAVKALGESISSVLCPTWLINNKLAEVQKCLAKINSISKCKYEIKITGVK